MVNTTAEDGLAFSKATSLATGMLRSVAGGDEGYGNDASKPKPDHLSYSPKNPANLRNDGPRPKIDFLKDDPSDMTRSRRIALKLMKYRWYYPEIKKNIEENSRSSAFEGDRTGRIADDFEKDISFEEPSLEKGWAYFEHQTLYRYLVRGGDKDGRKKDIFTRIFRTLFMHRNKKFHKAEPGEDDDPSRLYPWFMPHDQLGDFGIGIGLYFSALRFLIVVTLICGLISMGNIIYFASDYDNDDPVYAGFWDLFLLGTAICTSKEWVPCPTCDCEDKFISYGSLPYNRCAVHDYNTTGADGSVVEERLIFALKNNCDGTKWHLAATNFATIVFMLISTLLLGSYMRREEVKFDEDEQTAQDYSIRIKNPPGDANDPEEWRKFFKENFDGARVTVCTCAVENDLLIRVLAERRECMRTIASMQPGKTLEILALGKVAAQIERDRNWFQACLAMVLPGIPEQYARLVTLKGKVEGLAQLEYPVTNVFLTFETERDQRRVLEKLSVGGMKTKSNDASALSDPKYLFRGELVLSVIEPQEPSTIRWKDLNASFISRVKQQVATFILTLLLLALVLYIIYWVRQGWGIVYGSYAITVFGVAFPELAKMIVELFESHQTESTKQVSLYMKIVLFRWVTTTFFYFVTIPFTETTSDNAATGMIPAIYALFFSEITATVFLYADPSGHFKRHILAPRAATQDAMNKLFEGTAYELAERYTDMTKILLLCLFYCSIFPTSFFLCAISLFLKYQSDKFQMLRSFKRAPALGLSISEVSRNYFFFLAVAFMAVFSSYFWMGFPFDNICPDQSLDEEFGEDWNGFYFGNNETSSEYIGTFTVLPYPGPNPESIASFDEEIANVTVTPSDSTYVYCNMNILEAFRFPFVPISDNPRLDPQAYMNEQQIITTTYFGWGALAVVILILLKYCWIWYRLFEERYAAGYKAVGDSQGIPYIEVDSRSAYIPQVTSEMFSYPLIACRVDDLCEELFDFKDPDRSYKFYDLTKDAKKLLAANHITNPPGFSIVKYWEPDNND